MTGKRPHVLSPAALQQQLDNAAEEVRKYLQESPLNCSAAELVELASNIKKSQRLYNSLTKDLCDYKSRNGATQESIELSDECVESSNLCKQHLSIINSMLAKLDHDAVSDLASLASNVSHLRISDPLNSYLETCVEESQKLDASVPYIDSPLMSETQPNYSTHDNIPCTNIL